MGKFTDTTGVGHADADTGLMQAIRQIFMVNTRRFQYDSHAFRNAFLCVQPVDNFTGNGGFVSQNLVLFFTAGAGSKQTKIDFIFTDINTESTHRTPPFT
ncbi:hypothetical protein NGUA11_01955 [Salmonella enterica]|nr:hypothetical protein NGUA11_01955 [Salmonella enterica]